MACLGFLVREDMKRNMIALMWGCRTGKNEREKKENIRSEASQTYEKLRILLY